MWFKRMKSLAALAARVAVGTAVYVTIVVLATPLPAAAGLMLTFPALNGLAFFFAEDERAASIAKSMVWMPVVNGVLCGAYISTFAFGATAGSAVLLAWCLLALTVAAWLACVSRDWVRKGIAREHQLAYALAVTLAGILLAAGGAIESTWLPGVAHAQSIAGTDGAGWIAAAIGRSGLKIGLFALALVTFFSAIAYLPISDSTRGILAGLPLVPFGGLLAIAADAGMSLDERLQIFRGMMSGVWLGAAVATWFIYLFSRFLGTRTKRATPIADGAVRFGALLVGWVVTFGVIVTLAKAISWLSA
jgi:hypothetical protein